MLALDFNERKEDVKVHSWNDKLFMKKMEEGICKQNGHYELPLPLKNDNLSMPNNKLQAVSRLNKLKKRMQSDSKFREDYVTFMKGMIESGYAERVPQGEDPTGGITMGFITPRNLRKSE